ncbi:transcription elongation factor spt5 [Blyttiomyces sp. JEL0837]|nr:transcription elongation factor spt5 [Blyttiomyces sp. JEL0837]
MEFKEQKLQILSAFTRESLPGYLYIEAKKMAHVVSAVENIAGIYAQSVKVVPIDDMVACLRIKSREKDIKEGAWVRVKKGKYAGDLAKILDIIDGGAAVRVKLLPRIDYSKDEKKKDAVGEKRKAFSFTIPPQKLFVVGSVHHSLVSRAKHGGGYVYQNETFDKDGYLEKEIKVAGLEIDSVNPTLEEITKFNGGTFNEKSADLNSLAARSAADELQIGENVEVIRGEMKDLTGKVVSIDNEIVTITPREASIGNVKFDINDLRKKFDSGDHVKVINGTHSGETGMVIKTSNNIVTLLSDSSTKTIEVFAKHLRGVTEVATGQSQVAAFDVGDAVQITPQDGGVVIRVTKDMIHILNQFGNVVKAKPNEILRKLDPKRAVTSDSNGRSVSAGDMVLVSDPSSHSARRATVVHVYRSFVFLQSREVIENNGVMVTKNTAVSLLSGKPNNSSSGGFGGPHGGPAPPRFEGGRGRGRGGRDPLISKTVTITGGPYKGYIGIVKDMTANGARVELHTNNRIITIDPTRLNVHGPNGAPRPRTDFNATGSYATSGNMTPMHPSGSKTPMHYATGSRTPMHRPTDGSATPNPYDGSRTPAWDSGSRTPAYSGSRTPAWDSGSKTPGRDSAWDASSKTPARPTDYDDDYRPFRSALSGTTMDPATPFNPDTPHQYGTPADQHTPFVPQTPVAYPALPQTPGGNYYPNAGSVSHAGPTTPLNPSTPAFNPNTFPSTPFGGAGDGYTDYNRERPQEHARDWLTTDIEVLIRSQGDSSFKDGKYNGRKAVVKEVDGSRRSGVCAIFGGPSDTIPAEYLEPVHPEKKGRLKVLRGKFEGQLGELIGIDEDDGIVKLTSGFEPIPLRLLAKLAE